MAAGPVWRVYGASSTGAAHQAAGKPYEDAWRVRPAAADRDDQPAVAVAVADGHGHARHFRSARGAELAVDLATTLGSQLAHEVRGLDDSETVEKALRARIGRDLVAGWRSAVARDLIARPVTDDERSTSGLRADATAEELVYAYGATLIVAVAGAGWLMCAQIGDGDLFAVGPTGEVQRLVGIDPRLDGARTTSLCQPDAYGSMRFGVLPLGGTAAGAVVLATDGYGNAQARADWQVAFGTELASLAAAHESGWIGEQLPTWVRECSSFRGSGDDATMAIMVISGTGWQPSAEGFTRMQPSADEASETWTSSRPARRRLGSAWLGGLLGAACAAVAVIVYALVK
jgi:protein phosphatase 2C-like protein